VDCCSIARRGGVSPSGGDDSDASRAGRPPSEEPSTLPSTHAVPRPPPPCTALHCTALHCTAPSALPSPHTRRAPPPCRAVSLPSSPVTTQHCTALHCTALHCTALHCTALHSTALHCTPQSPLNTNSQLVKLIQTLWRRENAPSAARRPPLGINRND
jgi:hypothetical protein